MSAEVNIPDEAVGIVAGQLLPNPDIDVEREKALMALQDAAPLIVAAELERIAGIEDGVVDEMTERRDYRRRELYNAGIDPETDPTYAGLFGVVRARTAVVRKIRERAAELRSE